LTRNHQKNKGTDKKKKKEEKATTCVVVGLFLAAMALKGG